MISLPTLSDELTFIFGSIPPSLNGLYVPVKGRLVMTQKGKRWKNKFVTSRGGLDALELASFTGDREMAYALDIWAYTPMEDLYNEKYGYDGRVKHPFKVWDVSNLIKLAEDSVAQLIGVDDRNNFDVSSHKRPTEGPAHLVVHITPSLLHPDPRDPR